MPLKITIVLKHKLHFIGVAYLCLYIFFLISKTIVTWNKTIVKCTVLEDEHSPLKEGKSDKISSLNIKEAI